VGYAAEARPGAEDAAAEATAAPAAPRGPYKPRDVSAKNVATPAPADPEARKRNAKGELVFDDFPDFKPRLTPRQVIASGTWGGVYFNPRGGKAGIFGRDIAINHKEFPASWFAGVDESLYLARRYDCAANKYGVKAGADQAAWESAGWIKRDLDPRAFPRARTAACLLADALFIPLLQAAGSSGTAASTWDAAAMTTSARSGAGVALLGLRADGSARC
jgi:hypothetical protein